MCDLIGTAIQLTVGEVRVLTQYRHGLRDLGRLGFKQLVQTLVLRIVPSRGVPRYHQALLFIHGQQRQAREGGLGMRHDALQQGLEMSAHPGHGCRIKQVGAVLQPASQALRCLGEVEPYIEVGCLWVHLKGVPAQPRQCRGLPRGILEYKEHLKQRGTAQLAPWLQGLQQLLKGYILMAVGCQRHRLHTG